jgi:integrase
VPQASPTDALSARGTGCRYRRARGGSCRRAGFWRARDRRRCRAGLRGSAVVGIRTSKVDFESGLTKIWDEKKDKWRLIMPTLEALSAIRKYLNSLDKQPKTMFSILVKTVERLIQGHTKKALGSISRLPIQKQPDPGISRPAHWSRPQSNA